MARLPRLSITGEVHHVIQRGHNRQPVFLDDTDRQAYLQALRDAAREHHLSVHAYALLDNEVRLIATPATSEALSRSLQAVGRRYVAAFNRRHGRSGTLWEGRFRAAVIESERHFLEAACVLELAPVDAGLAGSAAAWPWSSAAHHLGRWRDPLVTEHPLYWALGNTPFDREAAYRQRLDQGAGTAAKQALNDATAKCWALGSPEFLARLAERTARPLIERPRGRPRNKVPELG